MSQNSPLRVYLHVLREEVWQLLSCALFTFLGFYAAASNKDSRWLVGAMVVMAAVCLIWATYKAWLKTYTALQDEIAKNAVPDVSVIVRNFCVYPDFEYPKPGEPKTVGATFEFTTEMVNRSFADTNVTRVSVEIKDTAGKPYECEAWVYKLPTTSSPSADLYGPPVAPHIRETVLSRTH